MDLISLLVLIGIIGSVYDKFKKASQDAENHKGDSREGHTQDTSKKSIFERLERLGDYIEEEILKETKSSSQQKERTSQKPPRKKAKTVLNTQEVNSEVRKKEVKKNKIEDRRITPNINVNNISTKGSNSVIPKEPPQTPRAKKNPFELTDNPITNAIIASEILGKPKCRK